MIKRVGFIFILVLMSSTFAFGQRSITVTSPNGGEAWETGSSHNITWGSVGDVGQINILLVIGGANGPWLVNGAADTGSFTWNIPASQELRADYTIRIIGANGSIFTSDESDGTFSIIEGVPLTMAVLTPNGGEQWIAGTTQTIDWASTGDVGVIFIRLITGGVTGEFLLMNSADTGSFSWPIPPGQELRNDYQIRVIAMKGTTFTTDQSDADFAVVTDECIYKDIFAEEWPLLAADLGLNENIATNQGEGMPERWGLAMIRTVLCHPDHPFNERTSIAHAFNLNSLETEDPALFTMVEPYKNILAAMLSVSRGKQMRLRRMFDLDGDYLLVRPPQNNRDKAAAVLPFAPNGDLDEDGLSNAQEFDIVVAAGGTMEDFALAAAGIGPGVILPVSGGVGLVLLAAGLVVAGVGLARRRKVST